VGPEDSEFDIGSNAHDRLMACNLVYDRIVGLRVDQHLDGHEYVVVELLAERQIEFGPAIVETLGEIPHAVEVVKPGHGVLYAPYPSGSSWWARRRGGRSRRQIAGRRLPEL
jgi:hypothetical protein